MAGESVLRSVVPIDICRVKDEICARNARDTNETKRVGGYGDEETRESDGNRCVWKKKKLVKELKSMYTMGIKRPNKIVRMVVIMMQVWVTDLRRITQYLRVANARMSYKYERLLEVRGLTYLPFHPRISCRCRSSASLQVSKNVSSTS